MKLEVNDMDEAGREIRWGLKMIYRRIEARHFQIEKELAELSRERLRLERSVVWTARILEKEKVYETRPNNPHR